MNLSPKFFPLFDKTSLIESAKVDYHSGLFCPAGSLAMSCLQPIEDFSISDMSPDQIMWFSFGYRNPLEAIILASSCLPVPEKDRRSMFFSLVLPPKNDYQEKVQEYLLENLRALCNLHKIDPSGAQIFDFITRYPFCKVVTYSIGLEVSSIIYFNLAPDFAKAINNYDWLNHTYDPTLTGG